MCPGRRSEQTEKAPLPLPLAIKLAERQTDRLLLLREVESRSRFLFWATSLAKSRAEQRNNNAKRQRRRANLYTTTGHKLNGRVRRGATRSEPNPGSLNRTQNIFLFTVRDVHRLFLRVSASSFSFPSAVKEIPRLLFACVIHSHGARVLHLISWPRSGRGGSR